MFGVDSGAVAAPVVNAGSPMLSIPSSYFLSSTMVAAGTAVSLTVSTGTTSNGKPCVIK